jgi:hypothetical protein
VLLAWSAQLEPEGEEPLMFARSPALRGEVDASFSGSSSAKMACNEGMG